MGKVILVTGGSRSGKSAFAEDIFKGKDDVLYIATSIITDDEMRTRVNKHIDRRNSKWTTYEGYKNLEKVLDDYDENNIMLDCITIMLTNLMFETKDNIELMNDNELEELFLNIQSEFERFICEAKKQNRNLVMVTNEVGYGIVPEYKVSRIFRDFAGAINQFIASLSDEAYLVACGLPLKLK